MNRLHPGGPGSTVVYVLAAVMLRCLDAGATVGVVLVALDTPGLGDPVRLGAVVGAAITLPHVLGPWTARLTALLRRQRLVVPLAGLWFAGLLAGIALGVGSLPLPALVALAAAAGIVGPVLTGGLSSRVAAALGARRASASWDALTYGVSGTLAPAVVAASAAVVGPVPGVLALAALGAVGGLLTLALPDTVEPGRPGSGSSVSRTARLLVTDPDLRLVSVLTWLGALVTAAALIVGITQAEQGSPGSSGLVAVALGAGGLLGAALLVRHPPTQHPRRGLVATTLLLALCCVAAAGAGGVVGHVVVFGLLGVVNSAHTVLSLAAREELPPPELRRDVFMTLAGTKVAFSAAGTAAAGTLAAAAGDVLLLALAGLGVAVSVALALPSRGRGHRGGPTPGPALSPARTGRRRAEPGRPADRP